MSEVSPSSKKVDEFLSSLSQLSQDRLRDTQKRQRDLQRDINELRRSSTSPYSPAGYNGASPSSYNHGITELKFNRSARGNFYEHWKDVAPELPKRRQEEESPPLPARPKPERPAKPKVPPLLPTRPSAATQVDTVVEIVRPVARNSEKPPISRSLIQVTEYTASLAPRPNKPGPIHSFGELEKKIMSGSRVFSTQSSQIKETAPFKPIVPSKPKVLKEEASSDRKRPEVVKPSAIFRNNGPALLEPSPTLRTPSKPEKPHKPTFKTFEAKDTQELKKQIQRLSPTKSVSPERIQPTSTKVKPFSLKPVKPSKPVDLEVHEAVNALAKLKPTKSAPLKPATKPASQTVDKFTSPKPASQTVAKSTPPTPKPKADLFPDKTTLTKAQPEFHAKLSSILRASTEPSLAAPISRPNEAIRRAKTNTDTSSGPAKLTHPIKTRAKGPRRKLPNQINSSASLLSDKSATSTFASNSPVSTTKDSSIPSMSNDFDNENVFKPLKKAPPPIRGKKPNLEARPKRVVSGELFI